VDAQSLISHLQQSFLICSGANGTLLHSRGLPADLPPDAWNLEQPDQVRAVAQEYAAAGADLVQANTLLSNRISLAGWSRQDQVQALNQAGVRLAGEAARPGMLVAGNIGPCGHLLEPLGDFPAARARDAFQEQAQALAEAGADLIIVETFFALDEARLAVEAAAATGLAVVATMCFSPGGRTIMGVTPAQAASLADQGAAAVGANCGEVGLEEMLDLVRTLAAESRVPVAVQPNAGKAELVGGQTVFSATPEQMAAWSRRYLEAGARIIGGCCGTTPRHTAAVARALRPQEH